MQGTIKVWMTPRSYALMTEHKVPNEYWLTKPNVESIELTLPIEVVESWNHKVNTKKILHG